MIGKSLSQSTNSLDKAIERMTTGYRINSASDDAAGYAVAKNMGVKLSSYSVAKDNTQMGLSYMNTATESLDNITAQLQRIRDLTEQASNGTYSTDQRNSMQTEIDARMNEINRIMSSTNYNGKKVFDYTTGAAESIQNSITPLNSEGAVSSGYTEINSAEDLISAMSTNPSGKYILMNDISLTGSLGNFSGELNGNGHTINISGSDSIFLNLSSATISNLNIEANITSDGVRVAALAGNVSGSTNISNITATGALVSTTSYSDQYVDNLEMGSLIGIHNSGTLNISNVNSNINLSATGDSLNPDVAGIIGASNGTLNMSDSSYSGNISMNSALGVGHSTSGGIIGAINGGTITNCYTNGDYIKASGSGRDCIAGIVGMTSSSGSPTISNCASYIKSIYASTTNNDTYVGGIVGNLSSGTVSQCYTDIASLYATTEIAGIAGIVGSAYYGTTGAVYDSYSDSPDATNVMGVASGTAIVANDNYTKDQVINMSPTILEDVGSSISLQIGVDSSSNSTITVSTGLSISLYSDVSSSSKASASLAYIDSALAKITSKQTELGAASNGLESASNAIDINIDNITSSLSTIKDVDIAKESSAYIKAQILQQASATLLVAANQSPNIALQLI